jgi:ABC-type bacteriocin/lantibiotic exporter with double-glycine peptidase domain
MKSNRIVLVVILTISGLANLYFYTGGYDRLLKGASLSTLLVLVAVIVALWFIALEAIQKKSRRDPPQDN